MQTENKEKKKKEKKEKKEKKRKKHADLKYFEERDSEERQNHGIVPI